MGMVWIDSIVADTSKCQTLSCISLFQQNASDRWTQGLIREKVDKVGDIIRSNLGSWSSLVLLFSPVLFWPPQEASLILIHRECCWGFFIAWDLAKYGMPFSLFCLILRFFPSWLLFLLTPSLSSSVLVTCRVLCLELGGPGSESQFCLIEAP